MGGWLQDLVAAVPKARSVGAGRTPPSPPSRLPSDLSVDTRLRYQNRQLPLVLNMRDP